MSYYLSIGVLLVLSVGVKAKIPAPGRGAFDCSGRFLDRISEGGAIEAQDTVPRFTIRLKQDSFLPGQDVKVTLTSTSSLEIREFYLEARSDEQVLVGRWRPEGSGIKVTCVQHKALTNIADMSRREVSGWWRAPEYQTNDVYFIAHVVATDGQFWQGLTSRTISKDIDLDQQERDLELRRREWGGHDPAEDDEQRSLQRAARGKSSKGSSHNKSRGKHYRKSKGKKSKRKSRKSHKKSHKSHKSKSRSGSSSSSSSDSGSHSDRDDFIWGGGSETDYDEFYYFYV